MAEKIIIIFKVEIAFMPAFEPGSVKGYQFFTFDYVLLYSTRLIQISDISFCFIYTHIQGPADKNTWVVWKMKINLRFLVAGLRNDLEMLPSPPYDFTFTPRCMHTWMFVYSCVFSHKFSPRRRGMCFKSHRVFFHHSSTVVCLIFWIYSYSIFNAGVWIHRVWMERKRKNRYLFS